jgi:hypothetical protein
MRTIVPALLVCWLLLAAAGGVFASDRGGLSTNAPPVKLGELRVMGPFADRITLTDSGGKSFVLEAKTNRFKIPAGTYTLTELRVKTGAFEAFRRNLGAKPITVKENEVTDLRAGGPFTNLVSVARRGKFLVLEYRLTGADGEVYHLGRTGPGPGVPPEFAIHQGNRKVLSGQFEFG